MRILIPAQRGPDSFTDNVAHTLEKLGHVVFTNAARPDSAMRRRVRALADDLMRRSRRGYVTDADRETLAQVRAVRPDMVLALTRHFPSEILASFRAAGVRYRVAWWGDAPANLQQMGLLEDEWDAIFAKDPDLVAKLRRVGLPAYLLQEAHNPDWHRPVASASNDKVVIAGNMYGYRQYVSKLLLDRGVALDLYGPPLPRWVDPAIARIHNRRYVIREEKSSVFGAGLACLNTTQVTEGNSLNCRAFEVAGAGGLQIIEHRPAIETCFEPGKEVLVFEQLDDLFGHLDWAQKSPVEARKVREAGHRRAVAQHTYHHRLSEIFRVLRV